MDNRTCNNCGSDKVVVRVIPRSITEMFEIDYDLFNFNESKYNGSDKKICKYFYCEACSNLELYEKLTVNDFSECEECGGSIIDIGSYNVEQQDKDIFVELRGECPSCGSSMEGIVSSMDLGEKVRDFFTLG